MEAAQSDLRRSESQTAQDVATNFYGLLAKRETTRADVANAGYQQQLLTAARANERVGRAAGVDTLRAQVAATRAEATLLSAQADEANSREALASEIGAPLETPFALPGIAPEPPLPQTPLGTLLAIAETSRPDVASAIANVRVAQLANAAIDSDLRPQIVLNGAFGNQTSPTAFVDEAQQIQAENIAALQQYEFFSKIAPPSIVPVPVLIPSVIRGNAGFLAEDRSTCNASSAGHRRRCGEGFTTPRAQIGFGRAGALEQRGAASISIAAVTTARCAGDDRRRTRRR